MTEAAVPVTTTQAPAALGPYSQAIRKGEWVYCSGQLGLEPSSGALVEGGAGAEVRQALANVDAVLRAASADLTQVVKAVLFVVDLSEYDVINEAYAAVFGSHRPARSIVQVAALPRGARILIDCTAHRDSHSP